MKKNIVHIICLISFIMITSCKEEKTVVTPIQKNDKTQLKNDLVKVPESWVTDRVSKAKNRLQASAAGTIVWNAMEAHGGLANWYSKGPIAFHFDYKPLDGSTQRNTYQTIDMWRNIARHQHYDDHSQEFGWDGAKAWTKTTDSTAFKYNLRFWALTPYYFLAQPFVLDGEGVILEQLEDKDFKDKVYNVIRVSFAEGTGDAPDDYYVLYFGKEDHQLGVIRYIVSYPGYFEKGKHLPEKFMELQGTTIVDGITLSTGYHTHWLLENETPGDHITTITVDSISFQPDTKKEYLAVPEGAKILKGLK
ncbi:DUF6503 family protein [uncultured Dokdonia sp.]|uniref:DUF6503 family protein n=1 Tax=uncultured Dokdonia sp. TaxID=575653 RepID=UPI002634D266|nr:DUF6503 family protein [uncultured Dokdonia sp.]